MELQPPMPQQAMSYLTDSDLRVMFAYLKSQPLVRNKVPARRVNRVPA